VLHSAGLNKPECSECMGTKCITYFRVLPSVTGQCRSWPAGLGVGLDAIDQLDAGQCPFRVGMLDPHALFEQRVDHRPDAFAMDRRHDRVDRRVGIRQQALKPARTAATTATQPRVDIGRGRMWVGWRGGENTPICLYNRNIPTIRKA
jgi:hypothetical protein